MRFYVTSIEHNREKDAENRSVPFAFDTITAARAKFHSIMASDMTNPTLDWTLCIMWNSDGQILASEKWEEEVLNDEG